MINGDSGQLKGSKLLKDLVDRIITKKLLSQYTWSGKSASNVPKIAIKECELLVGTIYETVLAADSSYTIREFEVDMVKKVMKVAYKNAEKSEDRLVCYTFNRLCYAYEIG